MTKTKHQTFSLRKFYPWAAITPIFGGSFLYLAFGPGISLEQACATLLCFFLFDSLGVQIGIHKLLCHRAFASGIWTKRILALLSVFSGQGSPIFWVAVHMSSHHPHYDTDLDIHSPLFGRFHAFIAWFWRLDATKANFLPARDYLKDPYLKRIGERHVELLLVYWIVLGIVGGVPLMVISGFFPAALSISLVGLVNSSLHAHKDPLELPLMKYQNYPEVKTAYNSVPLGFLTMGLGLHNNHHKDPSRLYYDEKWYEIDLSRFIIPLLRKL